MPFVTITMLQFQAAPSPPQHSPPGTPQAGQTWVINEADIPRTGAQVEAIRIRLDDLRRELQDAAERRNAISGRMREAPERALPGLEMRLAELDARILNIEREITRNDAMLHSATPEALIAGTRQGPDPAMVVERVANDLIPIVAIISMFVFAPIAFSIARFFWRRGGTPSRVAAADPGASQKLEQLQQAVDTIAIEIERISEGQRFVTRLLNERSLPSAAPDAIASRRQLGAEKP